MLLNLLIFLKRAVLLVKLGLLRYDYLLLWNMIRKFPKKVS